MSPAIPEDLKMWLGRSCASALASCVLAGCAPNYYANPIENLRQGALYAVQDQSRSAQAYLATGKTEADLIEQAKTVVADRLKDPESARFRNVSVRSFQHGKVVCGEVNGKNSYGGYVGFSRFVAGAGSSTLEDRDRQYPGIADAANFGIDAACSGSYATPLQAVGTGASVLPVAADLPKDSSTDRARALASQFGCTKDHAVVFTAYAGSDTIFRAECPRQMLALRCDARSCWVQ